MLCRRANLSFDCRVPRKAAAQLICLGKRLISAKAYSGPNDPIASVLTREWMLERSDTIVRIPYSHGLPLVQGGTLRVLTRKHASSQIKTYGVPNAPAAEITVLHDDLLHPVLGGNKLRKLDALIPALLGSGVTDVVIFLYMVTSA